MPISHVTHQRKGFVFDVTAYSGGNDFSVALNRNG